MSETADDRHDRLAKQFMSEIVSQAVLSGDGFGGVMTLIETCLFGALLTGERYFGASRRVSVEALEVIHNSVLERLAKEPAGPGFSRGLSLQEGEPGKPGAPRQGLDV